jgi:hypothetical protein
MHEQTRLFLCVLGSVGFFAALCGAFGAVSGSLAWRDGRPAGTAVGLGVARAFARLSREGLAPAARGAIVGGADGVVFGAVLGTLVGLGCGWKGRGEWQALRPILSAALLLAVAAVLFGLAAVGLTLAGVRALLGLFLGGAAGAVGGFALGGLDGLLGGVVGGAAAGTLLVGLRLRRG